MQTTYKNNEVSPPIATSRHYYAPLMETMKSVPLSHFGYPSPFELPYKRPSTAGWLTGSLLEFPQTVFWHSKRQAMDDSPIWVGGYDVGAHLRRDV